MKYENRRYNKDETSKEFYIRRTKDMKDFIESDAFKKWNKNNWDKYKKVNIK